MADADWEFIFDGVVGFLTSPLWQLPVMNFIEKNCIVFDQSEENCLPWADIYRDYKTLVEDLLSSYLKDVGIVEEQFVQACGAPSLQDRPQLQAVFEQIWAAEDFEIFKRMMVQRNIELELQALELIKQQQQRHSKKQEQKSTTVVHENQQLKQAQQQEEKHQVVEEYEEQILKEVIKRSKEEYEAKEKKKEEHEMEKNYAQSHYDDVKILKERAEEKRKEMKKVVADRVKCDDVTKLNGVDSTSKEQAPSAKVTSPTKENAPAQLTTPVQKAPSEKVAAQLSVGKPVPEVESKKTAADAASSWLMSAKAEAFNKKSNESPSSSAISAEKEDLKRREQYLKDQRDKLLHLKNKERKKQLDTYAASQPKRPTSARTAREAVSGGDGKQVNSDANDVDPKKLAVRKALADKLKKEIIYK